MMAEKIKTALAIALMIGLIILLPAIEGGVKAGTLPTPGAAWLGLVVLAMVAVPAAINWWNRYEEDEE